MLRVGITGGIGSGKTLVAEIFSMIGIPVYNSDDRAKVLMNRNPEIRSKLLALFGRKAFSEDGSLNRPFIASRVFSDKPMLEKLNSIVHPAVREDFATWANQHEGRAPYVLQEAALIFEAGSNKLLDYVILVWASEEVRFRRVRDRDHVTIEDVRKRATNQWPDDQKVPLADFIIINDGLHPLMRQVIEIHNTLSVKSGGNAIPCSTF